MKWTALPIDAELPNLLDALSTEGSRLQFDRALAAKLAIAVEELFLNTVKHGDGSVTLVTLQLEAVPDSVKLIFEDLGQAYNPFMRLDRSVLDERGAERRIGGLGVLLLEGLATSVHYQRDNEINRIELTFARVPPAS